MVLMDLEMKESGLDLDRDAMLSIRMAENLYLTLSSTLN